MFDDCLRYCLSRHAITVRCPMHIHPVIKSPGTLAGFSLQGRCQVYERHLQYMGIMATGLDSNT